MWLDHVSGVPPEVLNAPASAQPVQSEPQNFPAAPQPTGEWRVVATNGDNPGHEITRMGGVANQAEAERRAERFVRDAGYRADIQYEVLPVRRSGVLNAPAAQQPAGQFTGEWQVLDGLGRKFTDSAALAMLKAMPIE